MAMKTVADAEKSLAATLGRYIADQVADWQKLPWACLRLETIKNPDADYHNIQHRRCYRYGFWSLSNYAEAVDCADGQLVRVGEGRLFPMKVEEVVALVRRPEHMKINFEAAADIFARLQQEAERLLQSLTRGGRLDMQDRIDAAMRCHHMEPVYAPGPNAPRVPVYDHREVYYGG